MARCLGLKQVAYDDPEGGVGRAKLLLLADCVVEFEFPQHSSGHISVGEIGNEHGADARLRLRRIAHRSVHGGPGLQKLPRYDRS